LFVVVPLVFFVPGLLVCAAVGLRGWRLAAASPAVTFGLVATGGPVLNALGVRWSLLSLAAWSVAVTLLLFAVTQLVVRVRPGSPVTDAADEADGTAPVRRARWEHLTVGAGVVAGMAVGALTFLRGTGGLGVISQEWDAPFHANAVRWIAEHGKAVATDIAPIANIPAGDPYYYPITYHSLMATIVDQFGLTPSWVLNAAALTVVMLWPLGIAAFGLAWRVPAPAVAVAATVSTWFSAFPYDSLWRGPLWPFVAGVALLPGVLAVARLIIERYAVVPTAAVVALSVTGVVAMHPSLAFVVLVYVFAMLAALVFRLEPFRWRGSVIPLAVIGVLTVMVLLPVVLPARTASTGVQGAQWPEFATPPEGFGQVLLLSPTTALPQWWLGLAGIVGMVLLILRRRLLWVLAAFFVFGAAYAATASLNSPLVNVLSGPFYNDAWRFATLLPLLGAFAVAEAVTTLCAWLAPKLRLGTSRSAVLGVTAAGVVVLAVLGNGAYVNRNAEHLDWMYGNGPTVSRGEEEAYRWLADHLEPGERVMNDRLDGSVWMYAVAGVQPMEWTFYGTKPDSVPDTLHVRLNDMDDDPAIARMVAEANVRYVIVGRGFVRNVPVRAPGLQYLRYVDGLEQVYKNEQATIFEVVGNRLTPQP
jgi:hypothetical protein